MDKTKNIVIRYIIFFTGVIINSFGITFITKASLGTSPISSVPYVLSLKYAPSFGMLSFVVNSLFILGQIVLLKKEFEKIQILQIVVNIIFSGAIDISMLILTYFNPGNMIAKCISLVIGCAILGMGIAVEVTPDVLMVPGEGIVSAIAKKINKEFGNVKICFDCTLMGTALILSLIYFHRLNGIGVGTIFSAVFVGMFVKLGKRLYGKQLEALCKGG